MSLLLNLKCLGGPKRTGSVTIVGAVCRFSFRRRFLGSCYIGNTKYCSGFLGSRQDIGAEETFPFCEEAYFLLKVFRGMVLISSKLCFILGTCSSARNTLCTC
ncbi:V-ATPase 69 kDa subunit [Forsythia ovata]|uniref:V-ATPase 69 kDa subunit n=1 Tax=Forsythia ovata TaxID=205694 RepID=A0ABD1RZH1_9LAMI